jgi:DNA polymerase III alpha subunit
MLYQEDVIRVAQAVAGFTAAEADQLRKRLGQRGAADDRAALREEFLAHGLGLGMDLQGLDSVWAQIARFAAFSFCKAHAVTYGRIAYRIAYAKTHYPAELLGAILANDAGFYEKRVYVEEARRLGVPILGPCVNHSGRTFLVEPLAGAGGRP